MWVRVLAESQSHFTLSKHTELEVQEMFFPETEGKFRFITDKSFCLYAQGHKLGTCNFCP